jgi:hypothetical protein
VPRCFNLEDFSFYVRDTRRGTYQVGRWAAGDQSRVRDDEVPSHGFGGIDSGFHRSAGVVAWSNRRGAAPHNSLRVQFCLDGRAPAWWWQG